MPNKYATVGGEATLVHYRGVTTLPERPPDTSQGPCVVCIHDAGASGQRFASLLDALGENHSPIAYDQPGHGRSSGLDSLGSIDAMVNHLASLVDLWDLPNCVLVGEGMGAQVALQYASRRPEQVVGLVLIGDVAPSGLDAEIAQLEKITTGKARREFNRNGYAPTTKREIYQEAFADWVKTDPRTTLGDRRAQRDWNAADVTVPAIVIVGAHQDDESTQAANQLAASVTDGSVRRIEDAGLNGVIETPQAVAAIVEECFGSSGDRGKS